MDGVLVIDKPAGPTSHDVVARLRRVLGERRIGHTGTLDPAATGVLPMVIGRATRLARFLSASDKSYEATITLGVSTTTGDAAGARTGAQYGGPFPSRDAIDRALDVFRGSFLQQPPAFSAKRVAGTRSYRLARAGTAAAVLPAPVTVTAHAIEILEAMDDRLRLRIDCSSGFYVRALAQDLGQGLSVGAHLVALRRTRVAGFGLEMALTLDAAEREPGLAAGQTIQLGRLLSEVPSVVLTTEGVRHAAQGRDLTRDDAVGELPAGCARDGIVRLLTVTGDLVGIAEPTAVPGFLHPSIVLI
ncbi:MAG TPA: tRNA pseudouridine(55) synthase TruB [Vicinamibacterales bacterium]|nr:tRNA pseudouridine(55) synthase TruB [Vicinamibacterales bacterium]